MKFPEPDDNHLPIEARLLLILGLGAGIWAGLFATLVEALK